VLARNVARERATHGDRTGLRPIRGSVLVIVLVTIAFTSLALVAFIEQASNDLLVETRAAAARRLRQEAYSTLEVTLATLQGFSQADNGLHHPAEGWGDPLGFAGWTPRTGCTAEVTLEDESAKLPLSQVDATTLVNLFQSWQMSPADAQRLADALLGWMRKDYVPASGEAPAYDQLSLPYSAPGRSLRSFSELAAIDVARDVFYDDQGRPNDLWRRFAATFSIYSYSQANLNGVSADVLTALGFTDPAQQQRLRDYLAGTGTYVAKGPQWLTSANDANAVLASGTLPPLAGTQIRALRVNIVVREGGSEFRLTAVVAPAGGATIVKSAATSGTSSASDTTSAGSTSSASPPTVAPTTPAGRLNYPFTLLEIQENAEMPAAPPAA
jgi:general secretion pathway protein K